MLARLARVAAAVCAVVACAAGCQTLLHEVGQHGDEVAAWWDSRPVKPAGLSEQSWGLLRLWELDAKYVEKPEETLLSAAQLFADNPNQEWAFALAELSSIAAQKHEKSHPQVAAAHYLRTTTYAYYFLFVGDAFPSPFDRRNATACGFYNDGLAKVIELAQAQKGLNPAGDLRMQTAQGPVLIPVNRHGFVWQADEFDELHFAKEFAPQDHICHQTIFGLGVPMVGVHRTNGRESPDKRERFLGNDHPFAATAFFHPDLRRITPHAPADRSAHPTAGQHPDVAGTLDLIDPLRGIEIEVAGRTIPLEVDLAAPMSYVLKRTDRRKLELSGFLEPDEVRDVAGLYMFEPYQPGKIPVVFVHGLLSGPVTWSEMFRELWNDPEIRDNYQFWFFLYPTGTPFLASAAKLRYELREIIDSHGADDPAVHEMVLVGHSMGGLLSKLQVTDSQDRLWSLLSREPLERINADEREKTALQATFFFEPQPAIRRVVYIGTPHKGSDLSSSPVGRIGSLLVKTPGDLQKLQKDLVRRNPGAIQPDFEMGVPTSIDLLAPDSPVLQVMYELPYESGVKLHSIVGTMNDNAIGRGALAQFLTGGGADQPGDGVVPLTSAQLGDVASEVSVPATHGRIHRHPLAFREVWRILREHLDEYRGATTVQPVNFEATAPGEQADGEPAADAALPTTRAPAVRQRTPAPRLRPVAPESTPLRPAPTPPAGPPAVGLDWHPTGGPPPLIVPGPSRRNPEPSPGRQRGPVPQIVPLGGTEPPPAAAPPAPRMPQPSPPAAAAPRSVQTSDGWRVEVRPRAPQQAEPVTPRRSAP